MSTAGVETTVQVGVVRVYIVSRAGDRLIMYSVDRVAAKLMIQVEVCQ